MKRLTIAVSALLVAHAAQAWDYEGHRIVAAVAVASLPEDFPAFARSTDANTRALFLAGEPDRWRNLPDPALRHINEPDHYFDLEDVKNYGLTPETLPELRNELIGRIYVERAEHPEKFVTATPDEDLTKTHLLFGLLPYAINENFLKLKSEFVYLRQLEKIAAPSNDVEQAHQNIIYTMGVMSHFVGDGAQPLHVTMHHHGWVGKNPNHFTTDKDFHGWVDGGFIRAAGITFNGIKDRVEPAKSIWPGDTVAADADAFPVIVTYLVQTHGRVVPLYRLKKKGKLEEAHPSDQGRKFIEAQLLRGGEFLGDLYYSAFRSAQEVVLYDY